MKTCEGKETEKITGDLVENMIKERNGMIEKIKGVIKWGEVTISSALQKNPYLVIRGIKFGSSGSGEIFMMPCFCRQ